MPNENVLIEIKATVAEINTKLDQAVIPNVNELRNAVYGTGDDNNPGLLKKVDRLEQTEKRRVWIVRAMIGATVTTLGGWAWQFISAFLKK